MDISLLSGLISNFGAAQDIAKAMLELKTISEVQGKVTELQNVILSAQNTALTAQSQQSTLIQRVADLEKEIANVKAWEAEKQRYELKALKPGVFAYTLKPSSANGEPSHWLCANCYNKGIKSILQNAGDFYGVSTHNCHSCKTKILVNTNVMP